MKKDEKDAGSRLWNARISLASLELGFLALNLRSRDCSWRVDRKRSDRVPASRAPSCVCGKIGESRPLWRP